MRRSLLLTVFGAIIALCLSTFVVNGQEERSSRPQQPNANMMSRMLMRLMDLNKDGWISLEEHSKFFMGADADKNGYITQEEIKNYSQSRIEQESGGPDVGQEAPDFALRTLEGDRTVKLSDFRGKKPVVLVFGSYT